MGIAFLTARMRLTDRLAATTACRRTDLSPSHAPSNALTLFTTCPFPFALRKPTPNAAAAHTHTHTLFSPSFFEAALLACIVEEAEAVGAVAVATSSALAVASAAAVTTEATEEEEVVAVATRVDGHGSKAVVAAVAVAVAVGAVVGVTAVAAVTAPALIVTPWLAATVRRSLSTLFLSTPVASRRQPPAQTGAVAHTSRGCLVGPRRARMSWSS